MEIPDGGDQITASLLFVCDRYEGNLLIPAEPGMGWAADLSLGEGAAEPGMAERDQMHGEGDVEGDV